MERAPRKKFAGNFVPSEQHTNTRRRRRPSRRI
jgi:hypothetical protein